MILHLNQLWIIFLVYLYLLLLNFNNRRFLAHDFIIACYHFSLLPELQFELIVLRIEFLHTPKKVGSNLLYLFTRRHFIQPHIAFVKLFYLSFFLEHFPSLLCCKL